MMFRSPRPPPPPTPAQPGTFAVGKFAGYAEFVRAEEDGALERFDAWIDEGMMAAHERCGDRWRSDFPMGAAHGFLWSGTRGDDARLCGVVAPSRDSVGRDYPLSVLARFSRSLIARAPHVVPLAFGEFLDAAFTVVADARVSPTSTRELVARVRALRAAGPEDILHAEAEYAMWCRDTRLEDAWSAIFVVADPIVAAARTLDGLVTALVPFRGHEEPVTDRLVRLPLGHGGAAAATLWIDIARRIAGWSSTTPSAFWAVDGGSLLLAPGAVPGVALAELWRAEPAARVAFDAENEGADAPPSSGFGALASEVRSGGGSTSMQSFLDTVGERAACEPR